MQYLDGEDKFARLLIGIGRPPGERGTGVGEWVLSKPQREDKKKIREEGFEKAWVHLTGLLANRVK